MSARQKLSVFASSTSGDLKSYRAVARLVLLEMVCMPVMMDHFGALATPTLSACYEKLQEADLMLLLVAFRREWVPTTEEGGNGIDSITACELAFARSKNIPVRAMASSTWLGLASRTAPPKCVDRSDVLWQYVVPLPWSNPMRRVYLVLAKNGLQILLSLVLFAFGTSALSQNKRPQVKQSQAEPTLPINGASAFWGRGAASAASLSSCALLSQRLEMAGASKNATFLQDFPYDAYLEKCGVADFTLLERDRSLLEENGLDGDTFLSNLISRYLVRHPPDPTSQGDVERVLDLSDRALTFRTDDGNHPPAYDIIGYMVLDDLVIRVKRDIESKRLVENRSETQYILKALADRKYYVSFPPSLWKKLCEHIKAKDWNYIAVRLWEEIVQYRSILLVTFALLVSLLLFVRRFVARFVKPTAKARSISTGSGNAAILSLLVLISAGCIHQANAQVGSYYQGNVLIDRLYVGSEEIGSVTWIRRGPDRIKAKYFASGNVVQKYSTFDRPTVLVCEGAFSVLRENNVGLEPEGLTVDNGEIVNRDLSTTMDGLVVVYATGGIVVADIGDGNLKVVDDRGEKKLDVRDSADKTYLLNWAVRNRATIFQTQLLASTRGLRLNVLRAHKELRERRFLAIVKDKNTDEVKHVIVNLTKPYYLGESTQLIYNYLQTHQVTVVALLNLDVGNYDILEVYDQNRQHLSYPTGTRRVSTATNLLVYYDAK